MIRNFLTLLKDYFLPNQLDNPFHYYDEYGHYSYSKIAELDYEPINDDPDYKKFQ
ncbi:hypothetical protein [Paenibacillus sp. RC67]|uniref:hypothetical protein n=1 Tax=Paenibacillus sp. RC67 TaxID=3039392 RepID=UPI0024AC9755|nr:hypothetical protein [Paenibacillus sp. RC67]